MSVIRLMLYSALLAGCSSTLVRQHPITVDELRQRIEQFDGAKVVIQGKFAFAPDGSALLSDSGESVALAVPRTMEEARSLAEMDGKHVLVRGMFNKKWCSHACLNVGRIEKVTDVFLKTKIN